MLSSLIVSAAMITLTVVIHMVGLLGLMAFLQARSPRLRPFHSRLGQAGFIILTVLGLVAIHGLEMWLYAALYLVLGVFNDMEEALYFSISTFTTVGFGELVIEGRWRILGALESFNGFLLIGWSTAFMVSVISRIRTMEMDWLDRLRNSPD
ncbi:two pore domain potassium channel family protein [Hyphobacterium sp. CCMP332]|jgi:Ion channel|uniref:ion channel n=1 Tax=Hyphobacterium sp. CCMP332 TaxID=2749086 RepID=UPI00164FF455|nr:ion channel [Hyphobacterium sp. CCMP332]QNL18950.1 two pore domain potassium channel family protein [Hyphobacterium sp. CCMP332]